MIRVQSEMFISKRHQCGILYTTEGTQPRSLPLSLLIIERERERERCWGGVGWGGHLSTLTDTDKHRRSRYLYLANLMNTRKQIQMSFTQFCILATL